ncbi:hypothetical protein SAMN05443662_1488 [Sulfurivirga caldicuralii]|uniref:Uncharacterized protein n=1 Tax=Sulfurivirga caldicuralii TaxID=364032 RepID=A0A1N6GTF5_9GAMM|nr:hypothetical protein [Sulfurivirga caldicuralii]SIO10809.1 hypothetical protein SAMN05443662_1488 [Sulfurivirga caldicuralii]
MKHGIQAPWLAALLALAVVLAQSIVVVHDEVHLGLDGDDHCLIAQFANTLHASSEALAFHWTLVSLSWQRLNPPLFFPLFSHFFRFDGNPRAPPVLF